MKKIFLLALASAFALNASAEGYQVNTLSAKQLGMGHTGVSQKLNSESLWFNPAAAAYQEQKFTVAAGVTGIMAIAGWELPNDYDSSTKALSHTSDNDWSTPLYFSANYKVTDDLAVGISFNTPFGSSMNWGDNWAGAHLVQNISLQAYSAQPTVSYKMLDGKLSIGAGLMMSWGTFELSRSLFKVGDETNEILGQILTLAGNADAAAAIAAVENNPLASATLSGDAAFAMGVNVGVMYDICPKWSLGASYRSKMMMKVDEGHAELNYQSTGVETILGQLSQAGHVPIPDITKGTFSAELPLPSTLSFGATFRPTDKWELAAEFQWVQWSSYETLDVEFHDESLGGYSIVAAKEYSNTMISRVGAQFEANEWLTARAGFYVDESPVASDYLNPETPSMTKVGYTAGFSVMPLANKNFSVDVSYGYITSADPERMGAYNYENNLKAGFAAKVAEMGALQAGASQADATAAKGAAYAANINDPFAGNYTTKAHTVAIGLSWGF